MGHAALCLSSFSFSFFLACFHQFDFVDLTRKKSNDKVGVQCIKTVQVSCASTKLGMSVTFLI